MKPNRHLPYWVCAFVALLIGMPSAYADIPQVELNPDTNPSILRTSFPDRDELAVEKGILLVKVLVDEHGTVADVEVVKSTDECLNEPMQAALMKWRFKPALKDGKACAAHAQIPVRIKV